VERERNGRVATRLAGWTYIPLRAAETCSLQRHCVGGDKEPVRKSIVEDKENAALLPVQVVCSATRQTKRALSGIWSHPREVEPG
jgi:hypothetical protein